MISIDEFGECLCNHFTCARPPSGCDVM